MSFIVHYGLHGAAATEFASAGETLDGVRDLESRGAKYLQVTDPEGREIAFDALAALASSERGTA